MMTINTLSKFEPVRLMVGLSINLAGLAIGATQYLDSRSIF